MKKERVVYLSVIALLIALLVAVSTALTVTAVKLNKFDVNEDGQTNVTDVTELLNYLAFGCTHEPVTVEGKDPTCTEMGYMPYSVCAKCGQVLEPAVYIAKLPHTVVVDEAVAATCTETGLTEGSHCSVCGEVLTAQETVQATGHTVVDDPAVAPTCTEPGLTAGSHCSVCGEVFTAQEEIPALGHNYVNNACTRCGDRKGQIYTFGSYEQDNDMTNGAEAIEWIVLDVKDGKALLLSKYALDCQTYNTEYVDVTWETCTLRSWLNNDFYNTAFDNSEKAKIASTTLVNENNPSYGTNGGNDTTDNVFLLSLSDINNINYDFASDYTTYDTARRCQPTEYAKAQGCRWNDDTSSSYHGNCWWWLRSPGGFSDYAAGVDSGGCVNDFGCYVSYDFSGVRPALWIDL